MQGHCESIAPGRACRAHGRCIGPRADSNRCRIFLGRHLVLSIGVAAFSVALHAQSNNLTGTLALDSQLVDRGEAVTGDTPVLQGGATWTASQWSFGVSGGTELRSPGHLVEAIAQASRYWTLSNDWQMQASLLYYDYPGNSRWKAADHTEAGIYWTDRDILTFGIAAIQLMHSQSQRLRGAVDVDFRWPLPCHLSFSAGAGMAQSLESTRIPYDDSYRYEHAGIYRYGHAGLAWNNGPWQVTFNRMVVSSRTERTWGGLRTSPWEGTIAWFF